MAGRNENEERKAAVARRGLSLRHAPRARREERGGGAAFAIEVLMTQYHAPEGRRGCMPLENRRTYNLRSFQRGKKERGKTPFHSRQKKKGKGGGGAREDRLLGYILLRNPTRKKEGEKKGVDGRRGFHVFLLRGTARKKEERKEESSVSKAFAVLFEPRPTDSKLSRSKKKIFSPPVTLTPAPIQRLERSSSTKQGNNHELLPSRALRRKEGGKPRPIVHLSLSIEARKKRGDRNRRARGTRFRISPGTSGEEERKKRGNIW